MNFRFLLPLLTIALIASSCKKDLDAPPSRTLPVGSVLTIKELKALYTNTAVHFTEPKSVYAVVTADENDGNFYKNISVQDHTGGITLRLITSGGLYIGDSIRIYLPGTVLSPYNGLMQLDSVNVDNNTVKQATLVHVEPIVRTIGQLTATAMDTLQSMLIQLNDVEFTSADAAGGTWADAANQATGTRYLEDCTLAQVQIRTSGYASYAGQALPTGKGSIQCITGVFGSTVQLSNRRMNDVHMTGDRCPGQELPFFLKNFNDGSVTSGGWTLWSDAVIPWSTNSIGSIDGSSYAQVKNWNGSANIAGQSWLISPAVNLTGTSSPSLSFVTGCNYTGAVLQVLVSTDYISGDPTTATWATLSPALSAGAWAWVQSGALDMTPYISSNFHVAFKYTGSSTDGRTWEVDNIKISIQ
ncbi:MAG: choice-of-anchor J domain-containing protein [Flavobacteriales bacterium]|nr:choice-of-anchor J domain-containing protein [Flavobacteriales bacterium]MCC6938288.1 choice-of-anchor J domain-containing protein [Flavobacteriales bacterium]